jgi:two-component system, sensor histidine kinase PdtaS
LTVNTTDQPGRATSRPILDRISDATIAPRSPVIRWAFAAAAFVVATALRFVLDPYLPEGFPYLTFFPAIALTAFLTGSVPGSVVAALGFVVAWYFFIPPYRSFAIQPQTALALLLFALVVTIEIGLVHMMRRALRRLAAAEAAAQGTARSSSLMFAELQHRVSNNLAVVSSLLAMQRRQVSDPDAARALEGAVARVNVVSRLSRLLHDPQAQAVDFGAFLRAMIPDAVEASGIGDRVTVTVAAEPVILPADKAVPLGLVATELLSNALEHGFPEGRRGRIQVSLTETSPDSALLVIRDDGAGLPDGFDLERTRSLGLMIARQFAGQIGAELTVANEGGAVSRIAVPLGA